MKKELQMLSVKKSYKNVFYNDVYNRFELYIRRIIFKLQNYYFDDYWNLFNVSKFEYFHAFMGLYAQKKKLYNFVYK